MTGTTGRRAAGTKQSRRRPPAPPGAVTAARIHLLGEVMRRRVRWTVPDGPALWHPRAGDDRSPVDVTAQLHALLQPKWAHIEPWDLDDPPQWVRCLITTRGEATLMRAQFRAQRRRPAKKAAPVRTRSAVRHRTYRPWLLERLHQARKQVARWRPRAVKRQVAKGTRARRDRVLAALRARCTAIFGPRVGGHYRKHKPRKTK